MTPDAYVKWFDDLSERAKEREIRANLENVSGNERWQYLSEGMFYNDWADVYWNET